MTFNEFEEILKSKKIGILKNVNLNNTHFLENLFSLTVQSGYNINSVKYRKYISYIFKGKKSTSSTSTDYWLNRGFSKEESIDIIKNLQKRKSRFSVEYWLNKGLTLDESRFNVSKEQSKVSSKGWSKDDRKIGNIWSFKYWRDKGLTLEESRNEALKRNPSSRLYYDNEDAWKEKKSKIASNVRNFIKNNPETYKNFFGSKSKAEAEFFKQIEDNLLNHKDFIICINILGSKYLYKADGYYKDESSLVLIEFDGLYWHRDKLKDYSRDRNILKERKDISGIIRVSDDFFYKNKENMKQIIEYGIKKIKSKSCKKIKFY